MPIEMIEEFDQGTRIKVVGVGGGGSNAVEHMISQGVQGVEFVCANTDAQALNRSSAHQLIQLGDNGLGAGGKPDKGRLAAEEAESRVRASLEGAHMVFITAGMGGGTGTGAAPIVARIAKEMGILTVGVVTKPFEFEGPRRMKQADSGTTELEANVDSLIVVLNEKLLDVLGDDVTQDQAFAHANDVLKNAVGGISDIIHMHGLVNVDFEDVKTVMSEPGKAMMGTAVAGGPDRANKAAEAVQLFDAIHTVDRPKIAAAIATEIRRQSKPLTLFVQVNTGREPQKAGIDPDHADAFLRECRELHGLEISGLMCIPPAEEDPQRHFTLLAEIATRNGLTQLSMGMSGDYASAIACGATHVRVGSAIFGTR